MTTAYGQQFPPRVRRGIELLGLVLRQVAAVKAERDHEIGRDGPALIRAQLLQMAWRWVRFQPDSALSRSLEAGARGVDLQGHDRGTGLQAPYCPLARIAETRDPEFPGRPDATGASSFGPGTTRRLTAPPEEM